RKRASWTGTGSPLSSTRTSKRTRRRTRSSRTKSWTSSDRLDLLPGSKSMDEGVGLLVQAVHRHSDGGDGLPSLEFRSEEERERPANGLLGRVGFPHLRHPRLHLQGEVQDAVQTVVGRQAVLVGLAQPELRRRGPRDDPRRNGAVAQVEVAGQVVDPGL